MIILGITGGIGSGKSTISSFLESAGIPVYIADDMAKQLTNTSPEIKKQLISHFGDDLFENNILNKNRLASIIFNNAENLKIANSIIHPVVLKDFKEWTKQHSQCKLLAQETAILFESGFNKTVDFTITVTAPQEIRINRVMNRSKLTREEILNRMASQLPEEEKCKKSDFVVYNDNKRAIIPQIENIIQQIFSKE